MKKLLNDPNDYADQAIDGLCLAHPEIYARGGESGRVVYRTGGATSGKVGIVSSGGSGHLPVFTGYCGEGLLDACAIGNVFAGPSVADCVEAMKLADGGAGVLRLYGNYGGDRMNFDMADRMTEMLFGAMDELRLGDPWKLASDIGPGHRRRGARRYRGPCHQGRG